MPLPAALKIVVRHMPWVICAYFALHVVIRVLISPTLGKDEAEQVLLTQALAWGYGAQPPLYTWLTAGFFAIFGEGVFALALLKNILLAGTFLLTYATARTVSGDRLVSAVAVASLFLIPQIAWESQRALTHTVLVIFAVAFLTFALLQVQRRGRSRHYALLGFALSVGTLAKFNFLIIAAAKLLAAVSLPASRPRMLNPRILITVAVTAILAWRPVQWMFANMHETLYRSRKFSIAANHDLLTNYASGIVALLYSTVQVIALLAVVYAVLLRRRSAGRVPDESERTFVRALVCAVAIAFAICIVLVLGFEVTKVKERWLHPLMYGIPIALALWSSWRLSPRRLQAVLVVAGVCALAVIVMLPARTFIGPLFGRMNPMNTPYADLAAQIRAAGFEKGGILAGYNLLGGNLRLTFPEATVITPEYRHFDLPDTGPYLLVWRAESKGPVPRELLELFEETIGRKPPPTPSRYAAAEMLHAPGATLRLGYVILP